MTRSPRSLVLAGLLGVGAALSACGGPARTDAARAAWEAQQSAAADDAAAANAEATSRAGEVAAADAPAVGPNAARASGAAAGDALPPGPRASDVVSPEALVRACYDVISGPAGPRDWARFEALFHPELGRLVPLATRADGRRFAGTLRPSDYAEHAAATFAGQDFYERALSLEVQRFGGIAQVFSAYAITRDPSPDAPVVDRGVNSFQLCSDGARWYVLSIAWDAERPGLDLDALLDAAAR